MIVNGRSVKVVADFAETVVAGDVSYFGSPYSSAEKVVDISAADDGSVRLYLFATDNGYDAVVRGNGAIKDYVYTVATYTKSHTDNRPYDVEKITRLHIAFGITSIGNFFMYKAFNLKHLSFADIGAIRHLGTKAFAYTQIDGEYEFSGLKDTKIDCQFAMCPKLLGVTFGGTITEIEPKSFLLCIALQYVKGLSSVTSIGDIAFHYCTALESIDVVPGNATLGKWVFTLTPTDVKIEGTETALSDAGWKGQGSICFVPNEWTVEQLAAIRAVTGESVQFPIPESDNQNTDFYNQWMVFPAVFNGAYEGIAHPASGCCGIFALFHIYNILHPNAQYDTFYDLMMREVVPHKIKVTQSLYDTLTGCEYGQALIQGNTAVSYEVGSEITAMDLPMALDASPCHTWGEEGTSFWGVCQSLGWTATEMLFENGTDSGATVKQALLDSLADGKPVMMEIFGAGDEGHGMHAVVAMGYDAETDRLLIIDSTWGYPSDIVPLVYWCSFESLITPDEASAIWTFDFGKVVNMSEVNNKLDILVRSASFRTESGTIVLEEDMLPESGKASITVRVPCTDGAKLVDFHADSDTLAAIKKTTGKNYVVSLIGNYFAPDANNARGGYASYLCQMQEYWYDGTNYGWRLCDSSAATANTDGFRFGAFALKAGTYHWTAYYWDD